MSGKTAVDVILYNGMISTMDAKRAEAEAVAFRGDVIEAVGKDDVILKLAGSGTKLVDLKKKRVLPGLNDSHSHMSDLAGDIYGVDVSEAACISDMLKAIAARAESTAPGEWITVRQAWHESQLKERRMPTRFELDTVTSRNPLFVRRGGHVCIANSMALSIAGITEKTPDPERGVICRDEDGRPNGVLIESARTIVEKYVPELPVEKYAQAYKDSASELNRLGVTTAADCAGFGRSDAKNDEVIDTYIKLYEAGEITLRTIALYNAINIDSARRGAARYGMLRDGDMFKFGGIKLFQDGGIEGANMRTPFQLVEGTQTDPEYCGVPVFDDARDQEFRDIMQVVADSGLQLQTHAVGDASIDFVVNHYEGQNAKSPIRDLRWTICHIMLPSSANLEAIKRCGMVTTVQDHPYLMGENMSLYWGEDRANRAMSLRTMIDSGVVMGGGTDLPVIPASPFICIEWMVDRKIISGRVLGADQAITREEAIYLWTMGSARCEGWDHIIGSIEPGKKADVIVLNEDIFSVPTDEIKNITVNTTYLGGKAVYQA
ncbi:MAG: amidohydrolase [Synergistaceae bacterium]|jgi:predicted amidohydrolase YtcJ|nr:amidohydrolase [Synergistaceae bacterium]